MKGEVQYYEKLEKNHSNYGHGMSYDRRKWLYGIFASTKSEVRIAKKVLKEKYNEDFEIISLGGRGGTLTNDTFTVKCYPVSDPGCIFKAEIQKEGNFYPIVGRDTTIGYESIYYLTQEQYDDAVIGGKVRISLKGK